MKDEKPGLMKTPGEVSSGFICAFGLPSPSSASIAFGTVGGCVVPPSFFSAPGPGGTIENSPAIYRWVSVRPVKVKSRRDVGKEVRFTRPYGTSQLNGVASPAI